MEKDMHHVVYVIQHNEWPEYTKIGSTDNFTTRLATLNTSSPTGIKVIYAESFKDYQKIEKILHEKYKRYHARLEWYRLSPEQVRDLIFDLDDLKALE